MNISEIKLIEENGQHYADSRMISASLGIEHESITKLIRSHSELSGVRFEIGTLETAGGRQSVSYCLLPERESLILLTFTKNTERSKAAKIKLVDAFLSLREKSPQRDAILIRGALIAAGLLKIPAAEKPAQTQIESAPQISPRSELNQKVRRYSVEMKMAYAKAWGKLYEQLLYRIHWNGPRKGSKIAALDKSGHMREAILIIEDMLEKDGGLRLIDGLRDMRKPE